MTRGRGVLWSGVEAVTSGAFSLVSVFLVARLVGPSEMGIGAGAASVHVLLWVGVSALFADAMVQRATLSDDDASSAFWASALVGVAAAGMQFVAGWPLHAVLGDPRLPAMALMLAIPLPLVGAAGAVQGKLTRARDYRLLAFRAITGQGVGTLVGIGVAALGGGAWAVVGQQATTSAVGAIALLLAARWRPRLVCRWQPVRDLLRLGIPLTASTLVLHGRYRVFALLIGGTAGPTALGVVHMAFRLVDTIRELASTAMWRLMLPSMAEHQHDLPGLLRVVDRELRLIGMTLFPLCAAMVLSIAPLTRLLLGPAWVLSGIAALPLVALAAWLFLMFPASVAIVARGAPQFGLHANVASCAAMMAGVLLLRPESPVTAVWVWVAAQALVAPYVLASAARVLAAPLFRPVRAGLMPLAAASFATGFAMLLPTIVAVPVVVVARWAVAAGTLGAWYGVAPLLSSPGHFVEAIIPVRPLARGMPRHPRSSDTE